MLKAILKAGLLSLVSLVLFLLLLELLLRVFSPQRMMDIDHPPMFQRDEQLGHRMIPHFAVHFKTTHLDTFIKINSLGLRDIEINTCTDEHKILVLGDSFTFGHSVNLEDTYVKQLERLFVERQELKVHVVNAGVCSYSTRQEVLFLRELDKIIEPDLVILQFFVGNDIDENFGPHKGIYSRHPIVAEAVYVVKRLLWSRSHLYIFVRNRLVLLYSNINKPDQAKMIRNVSRVVPGEGVPTAQKRGWRTEIEVTKVYLSDFADYCRGKSYRCMVMLVPSPAQILAKYERHEFFYAQVKEFLEAHNVTYFDLEPHLRETLAMQEKIYAPDGHWNTKGNEVVANFLFEYLLTKGML